VVGLYVNPPDKAIVLCVDEKSQIQALDRTQPGLPMKRGRAATMTHDYKRNATTTLFAALDMLDGTVVGECMPRHRHQEFLRFLRRLDREFPTTLDLHLIVDNYGTHKHPNVRTWLGLHPRFHLLFTPTSSSWLNLVECSFSALTTQRIRRGSFVSVAALTAAIRESQRAQRGPHALHLGRVRARDPGEDRPLSSHFPDEPLGRHQTSPHHRRGSCSESCIRLGSSGATWR
jgi:transposase